MKPVDQTVTDCTCNAALGEPHNEACPVTHAVRHLFKLSGEDARAEDPYLPPSNTYGGFRGAFYVRHRRAPTEQEIFDAGVRSALRRNSMCKIDKVSSRVCEHGTKSCEVQHGQEVSSRLRALARRALDARDNDTRTDEEQINDAVDFICDTRSDPKVVQVTRFCPECGSLGPLPGGYVSCCPDGAAAAMIPIRMAQKCAQLFKDLLATPNLEELQAEFHRRIKPKFSKRQQGILMGEFRDVLKGNKK